MEQKINFKPFLNSLAAKSFQGSESRGRRYPIINDDDAPYADVIDHFDLDGHKFGLSKFARRASGKTQVFIGHQTNSHVRNRGIHTDEVTSLAELMASILGLNINLSRAIARGHDIGHTPFGHLGERAISEISGRTFKHEIMSVVVAQKIERCGAGLNLAYETLEGILHHSRGKNGLQTNAKLPLEYSVVMFADKIAYTFSDLNDALRCSYFVEKDLPVEFTALGNNQRERWLNCLFALVKESSEKGEISFYDSSAALQFESLRQWSYANFYSKMDEETERQQALVEMKLAYQFLNNWLSQFGYDALLILALMADQEVKNVAKFAQYPTIRDTEMLKNYSFMEIVSHFPVGHEVDIFDADLHVEDFH